MDTDDVSQIRPYIDLLEKSKATLKVAEGRDGEIPSDRKSKSEQIRAQELQAFQRSIHFNTNDSGQIQTSFFPRPYLPCTTSLKDLTPIYIKELRLGIHHRNRYLVVRSISVANRMIGIMAAVEDEMGDATLLQLYQQSPENDTPTADTVAVGDVFVVMEPYFKIMSDGGYGIRVDHINDIQKVNTEHRLFPIEWQPRIVDLDATADDWKQAGNVAIGLNKYQEALDKYGPRFSPNVLTNVYLPQLYQRLSKQSYIFGAGCHSIKSCTCKSQIWTIRRCAHRYPMRTSKSHISYLRESLLSRWQSFV